MMDLYTKEFEEIESDFGAKIEEIMGGLELNVLLKNLLEVYDNRLPKQLREKASVQQLQ